MTDTTTTAAPWLGVGRGRPEIGLPAVQIVDIIEDELRELPRSGYPIASAPIVVPRESYWDLLAANTRLLALLRETVRHVGADRAARMTALGIDPADCPFFTSDDDFELRHCADMARADVLIGPDGPKFLEFNVSGAFGGLAHFQTYQRAWRRITELDGRLSFIAADPCAHEARLIESTCAELGLPPEALLIGTPRDWGLDVSNRYFDVQVDSLRQHGVHVVHAEFDELPDLLDSSPWKVGIAGFTVQDAQLVGYSLDPVGDAVDAGLLLIPSQSAWLLHTKRALALLSEEPDWLSTSDIELVRRYVPWTRVLGDRRVSWQGSESDLPELLIERQAEFVLKGATGWGGMEVFPGWTTPAAEWARLIDRALLVGSFVVQERVIAQQCPVDVLHEDGAVETVSAEAVISPFGIGGASAGCYVRFMDGAQVNPTVGGELAMRTCLLAES